MTKSVRPILLAEDEESDRMILELAFQRARLMNPLVMVRDGQEAVDYLNHHRHPVNGTANSLPALILLDLKMPRMSGFDVLAWLSAQIDFKDIPAVVFSSSADESDMARAWQLGARDYFVKPHDFDALKNIWQQLHTRWLPSGDFRAMSTPTPFAGPVPAQ